MQDRMYTAVLLYSVHQPRDGMIIRKGERRYEHRKDERSQQDR